MKILEVFLEEITCKGERAMEMTEEEIVKKYQKNPQAKTINILADLNGCQAYEIKRILAKLAFTFRRLEVQKRIKLMKRLKKSMKSSNRRIQKGAMNL